MTASSRLSPIARVLVCVVLFYRRFIGPILPPSCRFTPSCSAYALEALRVHGATRGSWLTIRRLLRCAPWHPGGHDPVPLAVAQNEGQFSSDASRHPSSPSGVQRC